MEETKGDQRREVVRMLGGGVAGEKTKTFKNTEKDNLDKKS